MSSDFDSFDESPMGDFKESPLGDRNGRIFRAMMFIDESSAYNTVESSAGVDLYRADAERLEEDQEAGSILGAVVGHVITPREPPEDDAYLAIVPEGFESPVDVLGVHRPPRFSEMLSLLDALSEFAPAELLIFIDNSGSMTLADMEPTITAFEAYLVEQQIDYSISLRGDERWLRWASEFLLEA